MLTLYIIGLDKEAEAVVTGVDGKDHTKEFFENFFTDSGLILLDDARKEQYKTTADYAIYRESFDALADIIDKYQQSLYDLADNGGKISDYTFNGNNFAV